MKRMKYHVSKNGVNIGKFEEAEIYGGLSSGKLSPGDHYWTPGMQGWMPLSSFAPRAQQPASPPARPASQAQQVTAAARHQAPTYPHPSHPQSPQTGEVTSEERVQLIGYVGAGLLTLGTFGPFMNFGLFSFTILQDWNWRGVTVLLCGIASAAISYARMYSANWVTAGIPTLIFAYAFVQMSEITRGNDIGSALARSMVSPGWGLLAMCLGIAALGTCAYMSAKPMKKLS